MSDQDAPPPVDVDTYATMLDTVILARTQRDSWRAQAACTVPAGPNALPDPFFDEDDSTAAATVCAACPVTAECDEFAKDKGVKYGVWAGKSRKQRRRVR